MNIKITNLDMRQPVRVGLRDKYNTEWYKDQWTIMNIENGCINLELTVNKDTTIIIEQNDG